MLNVLIAAALLAASPAVGADPFPPVPTDDHRGRFSGSSSGSGDITIKGTIIDRSSATVCTFIRFRYRQGSGSAWTYTKWKRYCRGLDPSAAYRRTFTDPSVIEVKVCRAARPAPGTAPQTYRCSDWEQVWPR